MCSNEVCEKIFQNDCSNNVYLVMPKSIESTNIELGSENQIELSERGLNAGKKYRHQNYSKNIYIGTKNAEKWELTRTKLSFKNDVEFVTYLLALAENDFANNEG